MINIKAMKTEVNEKSAVTEIQLEIRLVLQNLQNMIHHSVNSHALPTYLDDCSTIFY